MKRKMTLEKRILTKVHRSKSNAFVLDDFSNMCICRNQITRALSKLCKTGDLLRLGYGIYAKVDTSIDCEFPMLYDSFIDVATEGLLKRGIKTYPSRAELAYNNGESTQIPTGIVFGVKKKVTIKLEYRGKIIRYERV